ncbi:DMP19 family protein [Solibacillus sp. FSL K6-1523]|uniref:DMP19 family protein n=1 Tax=Solibacillus sp. FSL K6-1523 TaxID=2921471 RepID=UPI0030FC2349
MKPKMKRKDLMSKIAISNAIMDILSDHNLTSEDNILNKAAIVYHYYSELESGGHESLFRWFGQDIQEIGIDHYLNKLIGVLEKIGAHDYAVIERKYFKKIWDLYIALENDEIHEDEFYDVIKKATEEYYKLNDALRELLETYFVTIHTDLIEVVED